MASSVVEKMTTDDPIQDIVEDEEEDEEEDEDNTTGTDLNDDDIEDDIEDDIDIDEDADEESEAIEGSNPKKTSGFQDPNIGTNINSISDDILEDSDDDYEYDEDVLKKLDFNKIDMNKIHPESTHINNDELRTLTTIVRNKQGIIVDNLHRTLPWITKYEYTKILGQRVKQLNSGSKPLIKSQPLINNYNLAELEIQEKKLPVIIKRPMPSGGCEYWRLQDLEINISI